MSGWVDLAACRGYPTAWWYPERGDHLAGSVAVAICRACPVRRACLDEALDLEVGEPFGIRGGLSVRQRQRVARARRRANAAAVAVSVRPKIGSVVAPEARRGRIGVEPPLLGWTRHELLEARHLTA